MTLRRLVATTCATAATLAAVAVPATASATDIYGGIGITGLTLGVGARHGQQLGFRAEYDGGISKTYDGQEEGGVTYNGKLKVARAALLADYHPFSGSFRFTGGVTFNDISAKLNGRGGNATINNKPVDLSNETFEVTVKYPGATPYLGLGWGHHARNGGLGFYFDLGVTVGKFKVDANTTIVGKYGVTQQDVDAEVQSARDAVGKLSVLPNLQLGLSYQF